MQGGHRHQPLLGGRAAAAAIYPPQLCKAILRGAEAQRRREGQALPPAVLNELAAVGWGQPACEPASAGVATPAEEVDPQVINDRVGDEADMTMYMGDSQVFDEYTGDALPPDLVAKAREEEVSMMEAWDVWEVVPNEEAWRLTGKKPLKGRWVDCNKGDRGTYDVRCRWVAKEVAYHHSDQFFAATPPLEALRLILSEAATGPQPAGVSRCGGPPGRRCSS